MASPEQSRPWQREFEQLQSRIYMARMALERSEAVAELLRMDRDHADGLIRRFQRIFSEAKSRLIAARSRLDEAQNKLSDARRRNLLSHRWKVDIRRWRAVADDSQAEVRRWGDESNRAHVEISRFNIDLIDRHAAVVRAEQELLALKRRSIEQAGRGRGQRPDGPTGGDGARP